MFPHYHSGNKSICMINERFGGTGPFAEYIKSNFGQNLKARLSKHSVFALVALAPTS
jgi:hypothetical protein